MVIYHGCGDISKILEDYIEIGIDAINPMEAKAGLDCVELRKKYRHGFGVCGNSDIQVWESGDKHRIREEILRKLNAAKGRGLIFQSYHSVTSSVSGHTYDYLVHLVPEPGTYPLYFAEYVIPLPST